jgi:hypothetical protein
VEPGALSGLPPGIWAAPSDFGAAEFGAAPVVDGDAGITIVPLTGGAGRTAAGLPSIGDADCGYARAVAAKIAAPVSSPSVIFCIFVLLLRLLNADLKRRLLRADNLRNLLEETSFRAPGPVGGGKSGPAVGSSRSGRSNQLPSRTLAHARILGSISCTKKMIAQ